MQYIVKKPVRFDRIYAIGEIIPSGIVDSGRVGGLVASGLIYPISSGVSLVDSSPDNSPDTSNDLLEMAKGFGGGKNHFDEGALGCALSDEEYFSFLEGLSEGHQVWISAKLELVRVTLCFINLPFKWIQKLMC